MINNIWNNLGEDADGDGHTLEQSGSNWILDPGDINNIDDDNDGFTDTNDTFPMNATEWLDTDLDGVGDNADEDDDSDGWSDLDEANCSTNSVDGQSVPVDTDGDTECDFLDSDDDGDGVEDESDAFPLDPNESNAVSYTHLTLPTILLV